MVYHLVVFVYKTVFAVRCLFNIELNILINSTKQSFLLNSLIINQIKFTGQQ